MVTNLFYAALSITHSWASGIVEVLGDHMDGPDRAALDKG